MSEIDTYKIFRQLEERKKEKTLINFMIKMN